MNEQTDEEFKSSRQNPDNSGNNTKAGASLINHKHGL